jgi:phage tail tape-measure protein
MSEAECMRLMQAVYTSWDAFAQELAKAGIAEGSPEYKRFVSIVNSYVEAVQLHSLAVGA